MTSLVDDHPTCPVKPCTTTFQATTSTISRFLCIPAEIRRLIYQELFRCNLAKAIDPKHIKCSERGCSVGVYGNRIQNAQILHTCKTCLNESRPILVQFLRVVTCQHWTWDKIIQYFPKPLREHLYLFHAWHDIWDRPAPPRLDVSPQVLSQVFPRLQLFEIATVSPKALGLSLHQLEGTPEEELCERAIAFVEQSREIDNLRTYTRDTGVKAFISVMTRLEWHDQVCMRCHGRLEKHYVILINEKKVVQFEWPAMGWQQIYKVLSRDQDAPKVRDFRSLKCKDPRGHNRMQELD